jgi:hypothetical protein
MQKKLILGIFVVLVILGAGYFFRPLTKPVADLQNSAGPTLFITNVFHQYLDTQKTPDIPDHLAEFFSPEAVALLEENADLCRRMAGTDMCGYGADADFLLEVQDYEDDLNFQNSGFKASEVEPGIIEVSFAVFPKSAPDDISRIRYKVVQTPAGWRVDDIYHFENGSWPEARTMRSMIKQENESLMETSSKLGGLLSNVMLYLNAYPVRQDAFATLFHFPIKACKSGHDQCEEIKREDPHFESLYKFCISKELAISKDGRQNSKCPLDQLLKEEFKVELGEKAGEPGEQTSKDGWTFLFIDGVWSIVQLPAPPNWN